MAGKARLDVLDEKIARLERARGGDALTAWVATLSDDQIAEIAARLDAGEDPAAIIMEFHR